MTYRVAYGLINVICMAVCYVMLLVAPSWAWCSAACGWTAAWYYHYTASEFIGLLVKDGVIEYGDE